MLAMAVSPLPKCQMPLGAAQPPVALFSTSAVYGGRAFDRAWLGHDLAVCGPGHLRAATDAGPAVLLGTAGTPAIMAELSQRKLQLRAELGAEGYVLDVRPDRPTPVLVAGLADAGVFRGLQTLRQLLVLSGGNASSSATGGCAVAPVTIEDWPDTPYRGLFMYVRQLRHHFDCLNVFSALCRPGSPGATRCSDYVFPGPATLQRGLPSAAL